MAALSTLKTRKHPLRRSVLIVWVCFWLAGAALLVAAAGVVLLAVLAATSVL